MRFLIPVANSEKYIGKISFLTNKESQSISFNSFLLKHVKDETSKCHLLNYLKNVNKLSDDQISNFWVSIDADSQLVEGDSCFLGIILQVHVNFILKTTSENFIWVTGRVEDGHIRKVNNAIFRYKLQKFLEDSTKYFIAPAENVDSAQNYLKEKGVTLLSLKDINESILNNKNKILVSIQLHELDSLKEKLELFEDNGTPLIKRIFRRYLPIRVVVTSIIIIILVLSLWYIFFHKELSSPLNTKNHIKENDAFKSHILNNDNNTLALWYLNGNGNDESGNGHHLHINPKYVKFERKDNRQILSTSKYQKKVEPGIVWVNDIPYSGSGDFILEAVFLVPKSLNKPAYIIQQYSLNKAGHDPFILQLDVHYNLIFKIWSLESEDFTAPVKLDIGHLKGKWITVKCVYRFRQCLELHVGDKKAKISTNIIPESANYPWFIGDASNEAKEKMEGISIDEIRISSENLCTARVDHQIIAFQDKLILIGGNTENGNIKSDIWSSLDGIIWKLVISNTPWGKRYGHRVVVFNDGIYLIGGAGSGNKKYNDVWFSKDLIHWEPKVENALWKARDSHACIVFKNAIWLVGGWDGNNALSDIWYSSDGCTWTPYKPNTASWEERSSFGLVVYDSAMWVLGGNNGKGKSYNDVWKSDDGICWKKVADSCNWSPRYKHTIAVYEDKMMILGGVLGNLAYNEIWYSTDGKNWIEYKDSKIWLARCEHTSTLYQNKIWVIGGQEPKRGIIYGDVWCKDKEWNKK